MFPFDPLAWDYSHGREELRELSPTLPPILDRAGGKAVGLMLCEQIAKEDALFQVPSWRPIHLPQDGIAEITVAENWMRQSAFILRSSEPEEDWLSPNSGAHESYRHRRGEEAIICPTQRPEQFIVQTEAVGIGCVVDIGWSTIAQTIVIRIATGRFLAEDEIKESTDVLCRLSPSSFASSATYDHDGICGVWNAQNGHQLAWHPGDNNMDVRLQAIPFEKIARRLYRAAARVGFGTFGIQFECVVHPEHPEVVHLVQVRPSPESIRRGRERRQEPITGNVLATSGSVSGVFDLTHPVWDPSFKGNPHTPHAAESILLWRNLGWAFIHDDQLSELLERYAQIGVRGCLAWRSLWANTQHQSFVPLTAKRRERLQRLTEQIPSMRVSSSAIGTIGSAEQKIRMVSDGLLGSVCVPSIPTQWHGHER